MPSTTAWVAASTGTSPPSPMTTARSVEVLVAAANAAAESRSDVGVSASGGPGHDEGLADLTVHAGGGQRLPAETHLLDEVTADGEGHPDGHAVRDLLGDRETDGEGPGEGRGGIEVLCDLHRSRHLGTPC